MLFSKFAGLAQEMCSHGGSGYSQCVQFQMLKKFFISFSCMGTEINLSFSKLKGISMA